MGWTITWEEFVDYIHEFMDLSDEIGDEWTWQGNKDFPGQGFIACKVKQLMSEELFLADEDADESFEDSSVDIKDSSEETVRPSVESVWEYHILYSLSYATPVLYFNAFTPDGRLLPMEILWRGLYSGAREAIQQMRGEALSQQEHPILRRPFFQLHPCKTSEFMKDHKGRSANPIVTWLSSMGPTVGLHLRNAYGSLVNQTAKTKTMQCTNCR